MTTTKKRRLLQKILSGSKNVRFSDFVTLVEAFGFVLGRVRGSHHIYKHPHVPALLSLQPAKKGQAKPCQVRQFLDLVEEYNLTLSDGDEEVGEEGEA
jgi:predicted RNA binding protein YcfA (HicA-like mRNA interferase family)